MTMTKEKQFDFINITRLQDCQGVAYKQGIRVHSMRAFRRKERLKRVAEYQQLQKAETVKSEETDSSKEDVIDASELRHSSHYVGMEMMDPFDCAVFSLSPIQQSLISLMDTQLAHVLVPCKITGNNEKWTTQLIRAALPHPPLLSSVCSHLAVYRDSRTRTESLDAVYFKDQALKGITEALEREEESPSNETILAVLSLIANNLITGDTDELLVHAQALQRMIEMRNRIEHLECDNQMRRHLGWHITPVALLLHRSQPATNTGAKNIFPRETILGKSPRRSLDIMLRQCRGLVHFLDHVEDITPSSPPDWKIFVTRRSALEYDLFDTWRETKNQQTDEECDLPDLIQMMTCLGGLIISFAYLRRFGKSNPTLTRLKEDVCGCLSYILDIMSIAPLTRDEAECALWAGSLVLCTGVPQEDMSAVASVVRLIAKGLCIKDESEFAGILHRFVWTDALWKPPLKEVIE